MQIRMLVLGAVVAAASTPGEAANTAFILTGNDLYGHCKAPNVYEAGQCLGYIEGVIDQLEASRADGHLPECLPASITPAQARDVVLKFLTDNPAVREQGASVLVVQAVTVTWCP